MKASEYPVTAIRWKPHSELRPKNILVSVTADGKITHWHTATGKPLHTMEEKDNPIMCLDFSPQGNTFATAGNDKQVRLYDDNTKTLIGIMKPTSFQQPGHSNRIFSICFHKDNNNLMASGGWDNTIQLYDIRQKGIINSFYGPHICGDSIDMLGDYLLSGSWRVKDQLQLWDLRKMKLYKNLMWEKGNYINSTYVYCAQFSKQNNQSLNPDGKFFAVGGSNNNVFRIFENSSDDRLPQVNVKTMKTPCYSLDFSNNGSLVAYGCGDGNIRIVSIIKKAN
jgi:COMPASS component SWD3